MFMQLLICHPKEQIIRVTVTVIPEMPEGQEGLGGGTGRIGGNVTRSVMGMAHMQ